MRKTLSAISYRLSVVAVLGGLLAPRLASQTSLSIYSDGRVVVRKTLPQALQKGRNQLTLQIDGLDPATLFSPDTSVTVMGITVRNPTVLSDALARAEGRTVTFVRAKGDTVQATVVRVNPPQYRLADGRLLLSQPGEPLIPAELVRSTTDASVTLDATRGRSNTQLAYVAQGVTWEATYQALIGSGQSTIGGGATVTSQGLRTDSADIQLVAGSINRAREGKSQEFQLRGAMAAARAVDEAVIMPAEQAVGEAHVYSLPTKLSLEPGVPVTTALFPRATTSVTQEFVVPGVLPWRGWVGQMGDEENTVPVQVWYTFKRNRGSAFGDRPLPGGTVQLYQPDSSGRVQLIGEATIAHTPAGKDVRVQSGDAFDVTAERVQTDYTQEQIPPAKRGMPTRQRVTAAYRVTVTNAKTTAATVDVRESHFGTWRVTESSVPAEKLSSTETRFRLSVPAGGQTVLTYTVQVES
jgi:hypothetical protein